MIRLVIGRKENGKTTLAYHMARKFPRLVVFDPRGQIRRPGATIARTAASCAAGFDMLAQGETTEVVYTPEEHLKTEAFPAFAAEVRYWVYERRALPLAVLVDEITFVNVADDDFDQAAKACDATRHHFFLTCHRPSDIPTTWRALADYWYLFAIHQEHDLEVVRLRCSADAAEVARGLGGRSFVGWDHRTGVRSYDNPAAWYVNLAPEVMLVPPVELDVI